MLAVVGGALVAIQGRLNGDLSTAGAGVLLASLFSFVGTLVALVLVIAVSGRAARVVRMLRERGSWWWFVLGVLSIPIVLGFSYGVPIVGVAVSSVCAVAGQIVSGLTLDARGLGVPRPIGLSGRRLLAAVLAVAGLTVGIAAASGSASAGLAQAVLVGLLLFAGGLTIAGQIAGNGRITQVSGDPLVAAFSSQLGGTAVMAAIVGVAAAAGGLDAATLPDEPSQWYLYLGGPLGAVITTASAWAVRHLGTFALTLAAVGGQLVAALAVDLARGMTAHWSTWVAALTIAGATALGVAPGRPSPDEPAGGARGVSR